MDVSSFIIGALIGVIGAFGTGFLKKAGEDCYGWLRKKVRPVATSKTGHLVVQFKDEAVPVIGLTSNSPLTDVVAPGEQLTAREQNLDSGVTLQEIINAIERAPPLQRESVAKSYVGLYVSWDAQYQSGKADDKQQVDLAFKVKHSGHRWAMVFCTAPLNDYRLLSVLPAGARVRVSGEIEAIRELSIDLKHVRLYIYPGDKPNE